VLTPAWLEADSPRQPPVNGGVKACRAEVCNGLDITAADDAHLRVTMTDRYDFRSGSHGGRRADWLARLMSVLQKAFGVAASQKVLSSTS
jgi:hypothetical protein